MCALVDDGLLNTRQSVEDDCASASLHIVDGLLESEEPYCARDSESVQSLESALGGHGDAVEDSEWRGCSSCGESECSGVYKSFMFAPRLQ